MTIHLGDVPASSTLYIPFATYDANGASLTMSGLATSDILIYKNGSVTQRSSTAGFTLLDTDGIDFDGVTGLHGISIDLSDNTDAGFYAAGAFYWVVISTVTVNAQTVTLIAATFRIRAAENTAGTPVVDVTRINNVAASSVTTINANLGTTQPINFTGTGASALAKSDMVDVAGAAVSTSTAQIGVNAVQAGGTAWGSGAITAASIATDAITAAKIAADAIGASELAADAASEIAAAVWDLDATGHQTQGTFGQAIGDPAADTNTIFKAVVTDATGATVGVDAAAILDDTGTSGVLVSSGTGAGQINLSSGVADANVTKFGGSAGTFASGIPAVNTTKVNGTAQTAGDLAALIAALNDISVADVLTTQMTESYNADGTAPTLAQALFLIIAFLMEKNIVTTTLTAKKLDGSTTAATFTLDDATSPTSITRSG